MTAKLLKEFLDSNHINYLSINHTPTFTAQEIAATAHISGRQMAKTIIVKLGKKLAMVVLPADEHINFAELRAISGENDVDLAREADFKARFPECEVGAQPPFGNLYEMPVYVSSRLSHDKIVFNSGTHSELIQMSYHDFERLVKPKVISMH
jgi:Ala-tRNA(Pro) deacylase